MPQQNEGKGFRVKKYGMQLFAVLFAVGAVWRALVALHHYQMSRAVVDDPSIRELEQVSAGVEGGIALVLLAHSGALFALSRRSLQIRWPYTLSIALMCAVMLGGSLLGAPIISLPGVYPASIVVSVAILSQFLVFGWVSLYLGSLAGSVLVLLAVGPMTDPFESFYVVLAVAVPCVALAFLGAGLRLLVVRIPWNGSVGS